MQPRTSMPRHRVTHVILMQLGRLLKDAGRPHRAVEVYRSVTLLEDEAIRNLEIAFAHAAQTVDLTKTVIKTVAPVDAQGFIFCCGCLFQQELPDHPMAHYRAAALLRTLGKYEQSLVHFRTSICNVQDFRPCASHTSNSLRTSGKLWLDTLISDGCVSENCFAPLACARMPACSLDSASLVGAPGFGLATEQIAYSEFGLLVMKILLPVALEGRKCIYS
eukprot:879804-Pelagomonas_calceolata.AAC.4